jgi:hypothetical protein
MDPMTIALISSAVSKGGQAFMNQRNQSRADSENDRREALQRIIEALSQKSQASAVPVQAQRGIGGELLAETDRQLDPLARDAIAKMFSKFLTGPGTNFSGPADLVGGGAGG